MSILYSSDIGWYICHETLINQIYCEFDSFKVNIKPVLFKINHKYQSNKSNNSSLEVTRSERSINLKRKHENNDHLETLQERYGYEKFQKEVDTVKSLYEQFRIELRPSSLLHLLGNSSETRNLEALEAAELVYKSTDNIPRSFNGGNIGPSIVQEFCGSKVIFPRDCKFFSRDIADIEKHINDTFDLILLDPPWWNKYIRRKRKKCGNAYDMLYNHDLQNIPIEKILNEDGLVVVWCTNSPQNLATLCCDIFKKWGVEIIAKWYWLKVTQTGETICEFAEPPRKQPFEQIIFACKSSRKFPKPPNEKILMSVPSSLHSHKPPLTEVLKPYLPENPNCLELFARYLLPGWTSYGLEVIKLQHESLYNIEPKTDQEIVPNNVKK